MAKMTQDMNEISRKTKIETVSMRVITLVTLFFLPGTFVSVSQRQREDRLIYTQSTSVKKPCQNFVGLS